MSYPPDNSTPILWLIPMSAESQPTDSDITSSKTVGISVFNPSLVSAEEAVECSWKNRSDFVNATDVFASLLDSKVRAHHAEILAHSVPLCQ